LPALLKKNRVGRPGSSFFCPGASPDVSRETSFAIFGRRGLKAASFRRFAYFLSPVVKPFLFRFTVSCV